MHCVAVHSFLSKRRVRALISIIGNYGDTYCCSKVYLRLHPFMWPATQPRTGICHLLCKMSDTDNAEEQAKRVNYSKDVTLLSLIHSPGNHTMTSSRVTTTCNSTVAMCCDSRSSQCALIYVSILCHTPYMSFMDLLPDANIMDSFLTRYLQNTYCDL
jgi:hypothetical protein